MPVFALEYIGSKCKVNILVLDYVGPKFKVIVLECIAKIIVLMPSSHEYTFLYAQEQANVRNIYIKDNIKSILISVYYVSHERSITVGISVK